MIKTTMSFFKACVCLCLACFLPVEETRAKDTLKDVQARQMVRCGVDRNVPGFSIEGDKGQFLGFNADLCRAVAASVLGDAGKVAFIPVGLQAGAEQLRAGKIDVLAIKLAHTMGRDSRDGLRFTAISYYDASGFLVRRSLGISSALELSGASVCALKGTTARDNASDFFLVRNMPFEVIEVESYEKLEKVYNSGRCVAVSGNISGLFALRKKLPNSKAHMVLPDVTARESFGLTVAQGDERWADIVRWVIYALINAEELKLTQERARALKAQAALIDNEIPAIQRLTGHSQDFGKALGLDAAWALNAIIAVGNYSELFDRTLGKSGALDIQRGLNALWSAGGLLYAPPIR